MYLFVEKLYTIENGGIEMGISVGVGQRAHETRLGIAVGRVSNANV